MKIIYSFILSSLVFSTVNAANECEKRFKGTPGPILATYFLQAGEEFTGSYFKGTCEFKKNFMIRHMAIGVSGSRTECFDYELTPREEEELPKTIAQARTENMRTMKKFEYDPEIKFRNAILYPESKEEKLVLEDIDTISGKAEIRSGPASKELYNLIKSFCSQQ